MNDSLVTFVERTRSAWGPLSSALIAAMHAALGKLLAAPASEDWLAALRRERPASRELHSDTALGFVLLAHTEPADLYRPPHDHGRNWVMYGVLDGEIEMGTYGRLQDSESRPILVKRGSTILRAGEVQAYLPGDIHDTRCLTRSALLLRFTERDLKTDDSEGHRVTRFVRGGGVWTTEPAA